MGRVEETKLLLRIFDDSQESKTSACVCIGGDGGIGKSAWANHVAAALAKSGNPVDIFTGHCDTTGGGAPLGAFRSIFRHLLHVLAVRTEAQIAALAGPTDADGNEWGGGKYSATQMSFAALELFHLGTLSTPKNKQQTANESQVSVRRKGTQGKNPPLTDVRHSPSSPSQTCAPSSRRCSAAARSRPP